MQPRFQADADFNHKIVLGIRRREPAIDFRDAREGGVIACLTLTCCILPRNQDGFSLPMIEGLCWVISRIFAERSSPGLILVSQELDIGAAIEDLLLIWAATYAEEWRDLIGFVPV